jgi:hypothetical protein
MWVIQLIAFQLVAGAILAAACLLIWKLTHKGEKPW